MINDLEVTWKDDYGNLYSWIGGTHIKIKNLQGFGIATVHQEIKLHEASILALKEATKEIVEDLLR